MESSEKILDALSNIGIKYEHYTHEPVIDVLDRYPMNLAFDGCVCKNLLITTRNEAVFLLCMLPAEKEADLKAMRDYFKTSRLCFASCDALARLLDQKPGSVGVLSIINDHSGVVQVVLDSSLKDAPRIAMHPGVNTETVVMSGDDLARFIHHNGRTLHYYDF